MTAFRAIGSALRPFRAKLMPCTVTVRPMIAVLLLVGTACSAAPAQGWHPATRPRPGGHAESPERVLSEYLTRRYDITKVRPVVLACGAEAATSLTREFLGYLTAGRSPVADSVAVDPECAADAVTQKRVAEHRGPQDLVAILTMSFRPDTSIIVALVLPAGSDRSPFPTVRTERYLWNLARAVGGQHLIFEEFRLGRP